MIIQHGNATLRWMSNAIANRSVITPCIEIITGCWNVGSSGRRRWRAGSPSGWRLRYGARVGWVAQLALSDVPVPVTLTPVSVCMSVHCDVRGLSVVCGVTFNIMLEVEGAIVVPGVPALLALPLHGVCAGCATCVTSFCLLLRSLLSLCGLHDHVREHRALHNACDQPAVDKKTCRYFFLQL